MNIRDNSEDKKELIEFEESIKEVDPQKTEDDTLVGSF